MSEVIAAYARTGGRPPEDDERLEIDDDGSWRLWRTMGGARVGAFAGKLSADRRRRVAAAVDAAGSAARLPARARLRPDGAHEAFRTGGHSLDVAAGAPVGGGWSRIAGLLRRWSDAFASPRDAQAAIELQLRDLDVALIRLGEERLRIWPASLRIDVYARDAGGIIVERASSGSGAEDDAPRGEPLTTGPGWALSIDAARTSAPPAGGTVEAWAWLDVDGPEGPVRVRLVAERQA